MIDNVYLMTCPERYKIGYSSDPRARRTTLRRETGLDLMLAAIIPGTRALERQVLHFFRSYRIEGEWFQPEPQIHEWFTGHRYFIDPGPPGKPNHVMLRWGVSPVAAGMNRMSPEQRHELLAQIT